MTSPRMATLRSMLEQDSSNAFARYGLAMEYVNGGELDAATEEFAALLAAHPDYAAGYFHGGQTLEKLGRIEEARALYQAGVKACARIGDAHTSAELQTAIDLL